MPAGSKVAVAETAIKKGARKKGMRGRKAAQYVYGALNNAGLMRGNKPTKRGLAKAGTPYPVRSTALYA